MGPERSTQSNPLGGGGVSDLKIDSGSSGIRDVKGRGCRVSGSPVTQGGGRFSVGDLQEKW